MGKHTSEVIIKLTDNFSKPFEGIVKSWSKGDLISKNFIRNFESMGRTMRNAGATMFIPLAAGIKTTVDSAMKAEQALAKVTTIMDTSQKSQEQIFKEMREIQLKYGESITDVGDAFYQVISATVDTANAAKYVDIAMKMNAGGFSEVTTAVNGLTTAYQAYNKKGYEAERLGDIMAMTQKLGKTTMDEISDSLGQAILFASSLDMSFEDLGTSIAVLTSNGANTSASMVYLTNALKSIIQPSAQAKKAFDALGVSYGGNAISNAGGFENYLKQLKNVVGLSQSANNELAKMIEQYQWGDEELNDFLQSAEGLKWIGKSGANIDKLTQLFKNIRGGAAIISLTSSLDKYSDFRQRIGDSNGELTRIADTMLGTTQTQFRILNERVEVLKSKIGENFIPHLLPLIDKVGGWVDKAGEWLDKMDPEERSKLFDSILKFTGAAGITMVVGTLAGAVANILKLINIIGKPLLTGLGGLIKVLSYFGSVKAVMTRVAGAAGNTTEAMAAAAEEAAKAMGSETAANATAQAGVSSASTEFVDPLTTGLAVTAGGSLALGAAKTAGLIGTTEAGTALATTAGTELATNATHTFITSTSKIVGPLSKALKVLGPIMAAFEGVRLGFKLGETKIADSSFDKYGEQVYGDDGEFYFKQKDGSLKTWYDFHPEDRPKNQNPFVNPNIQFRQAPEKSISINSVNVYGANNIEEIADEVSRYIENNAK